MRRQLAPLAALASLAFISFPGLSRAADRCPDIAQSVQMLHDGDQYQAASLLFAAARLGCEGQARALLDRGAAIDARDRDGATALGRAAQAGKAPLIRLFLDRGASLNARAVDGSTPLFYAAEADRAAAVALLLERGADPNISGRKGLRPLAAAAYNGSADSVEQLLKHGASPMRSMTRARARWFTPRATPTPRSSRCSFKPGRRQSSIRPWPHRADVGGGP